STDSAARQYAGKGDPRRFRRVTRFSVLRETREHSRTFPIRHFKMLGLRTGVVLKVRSRGDDTGETGARSGRASRIWLPWLLLAWRNEVAGRDVVIPWFCGQAVR